MNMIFAQINKQIRNKKTFPKVFPALTTPWMYIIAGVELVPTTTGRSHDMEIV